jgi:hypothetical protein
MKSLFILIVVVVFSSSLNYSFGGELCGYSGFAIQNEPDTTALWEQLNINQDARAESLLQRHVDINRGREKTKGYRIQIFSEAGGNARKRAMGVKSSFLSYYHDVKAEVIYSTPDFKVRVGNFRTRSEALKFQKGIDRKFPNAIIVPDEIDFPELE